MKLFKKTKIKALIVGFVLAKIIVTGYYLSGKFDPAAFFIHGSTAVAETKDEGGAGESNGATAPEGADDVSEEVQPLLQPEDIRAVMDTLEKKRIALQEEEGRLKKERARLDSLKQEIEEKIAEMTAVQKKIEADLKQKADLAAEQEKKKKTAESAKIKQLVKVYSSMKPKNAAAIVDKMNMNVVLQVFSNMKGEQVGRILTYVNQDRAAKISEWLATKDVK